jgi:hypothetical protein
MSVPKRLVRGCKCAIAFAAISCAVVVGLSALIGFAEMSLEQSKKLLVAFGDVRFIRMVGALSFVAFVVGVLCDDW